MIRIKPRPYTGRVNKETFVAIAGQTVFNLTETLTNNDLVFVGGQLTDQDISAGYGTKVLTFPIGLNAFDVVTVK